MARWIKDLKKTLEEESWWHDGKNLNVYCCSLYS
jgi:hypothetical protein